MSSNNREIEKKFIVIDHETVNSVVDKLTRTINKYISLIIYGSGTDYFWLAPEVDFIRIRKFHVGGGEQTIKRTDKGSILDRLEVNVRLRSACDVDDSIKFFTELYGTYKIALWKEFVNMKQGSSCVTVYRANFCREIFLEIEADSIEEVNKLEIRVRKQLNLQQIDKSLLQLALIYKGGHRNADQ